MFMAFLLYNAPLYKAQHHALRFQVEMIDVVVTAQWFHVMSLEFSLIITYVIYYALLAEPA